MASNGPISRKSVKSGVSSNPRAGKRQKTHVVINVDDDVDEDADENADDEAGEYSASEGNEARQRELIKAHNASGVEIARENRKITRMHATRVAVLEGQAKLERQRAEECRRIAQKESDTAAATAHTLEQAKQLLIAQREDLRGTRARINELEKSEAAARAAQRAAEQRLEPVHSAYARRQTLMRRMDGGVVPRVRALSNLLERAGNNEKEWGAGERSAIGTNVVVLVHGWKLIREEYAAVMDEPGGDAPR